MGEQHWVISDSAQCIEMILTGLYADLLSTWYCVLLDVHCSYDTFNVFFKKMSLLHVMGLRVSLWCGWFGHDMSTISNDQELGMWYYFKLRLKDIIPYRVVDWPCKIKKYRPQTIKPVHDRVLKIDKGPLLAKFSCQTNRKDWFMQNTRHFTRRYSAPSSG